MSIPKGILHEEKWNRDDLRENKQVLNELICLRLNVCEIEWETSKNAYM